MSLKCPDPQCAIYTLTHNLPGLGHCPPGASGEQDTLKVKAVREGW